jgi:hypothetical protein
VTVPSEGPFAALALARELAPGLVADGRTGPSPAQALGRALSLRAEDRERYRADAVDLVERHTRGRARGPPA